MNKVLQELVDSARELCALQGSYIPEGDEQVGTLLLDYYGKCPVCHRPVDFKPEVAVNVVECRGEFISRLGLALQKHYQDSPACQPRMNAMRDDPAFQGHLKNKVKGYTQEDLDRWIS